MKDVTESHCRACLEAIQPGALRCPHCQASQRPQRWQIVGDILKWTGGITAVLSLFLVMQQVNNVVGAWTDKQESLDALVRASQLQARAGDYAGAWGLLEEALALEPGSSTVQAARVDLAMVWLRNFSATSGRISDTVSRLLPSLYLGAARSTSIEKADALAHIGFSQMRRIADGERNLQVDEQLRAALDADPDNVFAHVWSAQWLYQPQNTTSSAQSRLTLARQHFGQALATGERSGWVRRIQLSTYLGSFDPTANAEAVRVILELREQGDELPAIYAENFVDLVRALTVETTAEMMQFRNTMLESLSWREIFDAYAWVTELEITEHLLIDDYALAKLNEHTGNAGQALEIYLSLAPDASSGHTFSRALVESIARLSGSKVDQQQEDTHSPPIGKIP